MAEDLKVIKGTKEQKYRSILPQIRSLIRGETDLIANLANVSAALKQQFDWFWVGFYLVRDEELVVGPFQGPIACTRIKKGKGVCGRSWVLGKPLIVDDVNAFDGHIACSSLSQSEIVIPVKKDGEVVMILDVDSESLAHFDEIDADYLSQIVELLPL